MFDIRIINLNLGSYLRMTSKNDLAKAEKVKKDLYLQAFLDQRHYFTPMVYSTDRITGAEALAAQKRLTALIRLKLKQEPSEFCDFLWASISLAIVRSNILLLFSPQDKEARILHKPYLLDG